MNEATTTSDPSTTPIEDLNLNVRAYGALKRKGVDTFSQLVGLYDDELIEMVGLRFRDIDEIQAKLKPLGRSIKL